MAGLGHLCAGQCVQGAASRAGTHPRHLGVASPLRTVDLGWMPNLVNSYARCIRWWRVSMSCRAASGVRPLSGFAAKFR